MIEPEVLLLDEPTAGLDPQTTRDIIGVIYDAHQAGKTVVMATHDLHIVEVIADVVHVFRKEKTIIRSGKQKRYLPVFNFSKVRTSCIFMYTGTFIKHMYIAMMKRTGDDFFKIIRKSDLIFCQVKQKHHSLFSYE